MTDNNGKALREAKACLADADVASVAGMRLKTALAALVEEVEAAPVVRFWLGDTSDSFVVNSPKEAEAVQIGKHVRLLPAPPAIDAAMAAEGRE